MDRLRLRKPQGNAYPVNPIHYLAYGPVDRGRFVRSGIPPETEVRFLLQWRRAPGEEARKIFDLALWAWLNLGGIGSRSRKGFGSLRCLKVQRGTSPDRESERRLTPGNPQSYREQLADLLVKPGPGDGAPLPAWSHFSSSSQIFLGATNHSSWRDAMSHLGAWLMAFRRRYGHPGDGRQADGMAVASRDYASRDYAWARNPGARSAEVPDRAGFGLPLAFRFRNGPETSLVWENGNPHDELREARRASPLLLHVAKFAHGAYCPVLTYLPARLIPQGRRLRLKERNAARSTAAMEPTQGQLTVVQRFLADLDQKNLVQEVSA